MRKERSIYIFFIGFVISFLGSLPLGTLNILVANLAYKDYKEAIWFGLGAIIIEMLIVVVGIKTVQHLNRLYYLVRIMKVFMVSVLFLISWLSFQNFLATNIQGQGTSLFFESHTFISGMVLSLINPLHLPFWMTWVKVLEKKGIVFHRSSYIVLFMFSIGLGTSLAFQIYASLGNYVIPIFKNSERTMYLILACFFMMMGVYQLYKNFLKPLIKM